MKIFDCFPYFDEDLLLECRLNILNDYVYKFVIVESSYTHSGNKKKLNFNLNKFNKFKNKIIYIQSEELPNNLERISDNISRNEQGHKLINNANKRENFQRNKLIEGLNEAKEHDLIIISDLDEIPKLDNINFDNIKDSIFVFKQKMFYYKFNLSYHGYTWYGPKICKKKNFLNPVWLRNMKSKKYPLWRIDTFFSKKKSNNIIHIEDGGWHFTSLKSPSDLQYKMLSFAHHLEYESSNSNLAKLERLIKEKKINYDHTMDKKKIDKWSKEINLTKVSDSHLPKYLIENKIKYKEWFD